MSITAEQERGFYDGVYSKFLNRPDHELRVNLEVMESALRDSRQPMFERRRLYAEVLHRLQAMPLASSRAFSSRHVNSIEISNALMAAARCMLSCG